MDAGSIPAASTIAIASAMLFIPPLPFVLIFADAGRAPVCTQGAIAMMLQVR